VRAQQIAAGSRGRDGTCPVGWFRCSTCGREHTRTMARWTALILLLTAAAATAQTVRVRIGNSTQGLPLERYVAGVLAGESSVFRSPEAQKAMAVAARTYAVRLRGRHKSEG